MSRVLQCIAQRFRQDFDFGSGQITQFTKSQWESFDLKDESTYGPSTPYVAYRVFYCAIFLVLIFYSIVCPTFLYFIFLTNWSLMFQAVYSLLSLTAVILEVARLKRRQADVLTNLNGNVQIELGVKSRSETAIKTESEDNSILDAGGVDLEVENTMKEDQEDNPMSHANNDTISIKGTLPPINMLHKVIWILTNIVYLLPHVVTLAYWLVVHNPNDLNPMKCVRYRTFFLVHSLNSLLALVDFFIVAIPVRFFHNLFPTALAAFYCSFTYIYEAAGGRYMQNKEYIYPSLNWRHKPVKASVSTIFGVIAAPIGHYLFCYIFYKLRNVIYNWKKRQVNTM